MACESASLVVGLGAHWFDQARRRDRIEPEKSGCSDMIVVVEDDEVKVGAVQRGLEEPLLDSRSVALDRVVWRGLRVESRPQPVLCWQRTDSGRASASSPVSAYPLSSIVKPRSDSALRRWWSVRSTSSCTVPIPEARAWSSPRSTTVATSSGVAPGRRIGPISTRSSTRS